MWKRTLQGTAGILGAASLTLGADAAVFNVEPLPEQAHDIAQERVVVRQVEDTVEAHFPWKGEEGLKIKYDMGRPGGWERAKDQRNKQVIVEPVVYGDGGMKVDLILNEKPNTNVFCYQIEGWENYDFFYQPPLTPEEIAEGAERPEEIVGSYAVYHKTLKNHVQGQTNYETGKVAHIPYPYVWEVGNEANKFRAEAFDITDGNMCVTVQQDFLDSASYPVRVDPTFGYTSVGASSLNAGGFNRIRASGDTYTGVAGTGVSMHINAGSGSANSPIEMAVYNSDQSLLTNAITDEVTVNSATFQWWSANFTVSPTFTAVEYYLSYGIENVTNGRSVSYDTGAVSGESVFEPWTYSSWEDPVTWSSSIDAIFSIYVTYTATGGGSSPTITPSAIIFE